MRLFRRMSDLLTANLHDLLDRWEDPVQILRQAVREIEHACTSAMEATARAIAQERLLAARSQNLKSQLGRWQTRAAMAVGSGDDDAARRSVIARLRCQQQLEECIVQHRTATDLADRLRGELQQLRTRLFEAQQLQQTYTSRHRMSQARQSVTRSTKGVAAGHHAYFRLQQACTVIDCEEAQSLAVQELCEDISPPLSDFDAEVELELHALRAQVSSQGDDDNRDETAL